MVESKADRLPTVFIGSSSEGMDEAREVELQLVNDAITTIWKDGVFGPGEGTLESLMNALEQYDFAVMVLSPDDLTETRGGSLASPRDNVIFELGLFMGRLGRSRVFIVHEESANLKLPSDLAGITTLTYRRRENLAAALSPACTPIIKAIRALGFSEGRTQDQIRRLEDRQESLESKLQALTSQFTLQGIVSKHELGKLRGLAAEGPFLVKYHHRMYEELHRLDAIEYVAPTKDHSLVDLKRDYSRRRKDEFDLKQYVNITRKGHDYLKLLEQRLPQEGQ